MAGVYFDTSAFVKLLVQEPGTDLADDLWNGCDTALASRLAYPEVRAALAAAHRNRTLSTTAITAAEGTWDRYWQAVRPVELSRRVERLAGKLSRDHELSGADAVHLASALVLDDPGVVVATWDRRLRAAAENVRLAVAPTSLGR